MRVLADMQKPKPQSEKVILLGVKARKKMGKIWSGLWEMFVPRTKHWILGQRTYFTIKEPVVLATTEAPRG